MKKWYAGLIAAVMIAMAGCSSQSSTEAVSSAEASAEAEESQETEPEEEETEEAGEGKEESLQEARESMKAAEESLKALEESLQVAEESLQAAEESAQAEGESDFAALEKDPEKYEKKQVKFSGTVVRAAGIGNTSGQLVVAVDGDEKQRLVAEYKKSIVNTALAVGDKVTLTGEFQGIIRYRMQSGGAESMPTINVEKIEDIVKAVPETQAETQALFDVPETQPEGMQIPAGEITSGEPDETEPSADSSEGDGDNGEIMDAEPSAETSPVISAGQ